ncbi:MFS general substrate transporter [Pholiota conissans]|uniref:MFS general substrate transporter n=1 Tax=Pholiota conissans TaxID=109636 RepID=A0A9P6CSF8_9AGAR|nr:MFS general substrate transporter [Pholiota conissans]
MRETGTTVAKDTSDRIKGQSTMCKPPQSPAVDIEHVFVHDDPRKWSKPRKRFTLAIVSGASLLLTLAVSIYNPAINNIIVDLHTTYEKISWTLSANALVTGVTPLLWGAFTEVYGRKVVYLISIVLFIIGSGVAGDAKNVTVLIVMRAVQGMGASAVLTIGAATLADMYDPKERGAVMGIYYAAPLLGPSLGPIIGGALAQAFSWRAIFYFLAIFGGVSLLSFLFFKDTFRRERSLSYQAALRQATEARRTSSDDVETLTISVSAEKKELDSVTPDPERQSQAPLKIGLRHMQVVTPTLLVFKRINNVCVLTASGLIFGSISYCLAFTTVRTLGAAPYNYKSLQIGLVLLSLGVGSILGSLLGGRWSDRVRRRFQEKNNGVSKSEDRLNSSKIMLPVLPASIIAYAWMADKKIVIAPLCVALFFAGFSSAWIYSSILAYIVDANTGRSSSAVAANSFLRGIMAFVAAEVAVPLQDALGDGGLYTLIAGLMVIVDILILLLIGKGSEWRERAEETEKRRIASSVTPS